MDKNKSEKWFVRVACFVICLMLMLIVPIAHSHKLLGHELGNDTPVDSVGPITKLADGVMVINTTEIAKDVIGYAGSTPVEITVRDGRIEKIKGLPNQETPEFFGAVRNSNLLKTLNGMTLEEAAKADIDAVSGATYTSQAIIKNIKAGIACALMENGVEAEIVPDGEPEKWSLKFFVTLFVIVIGGVVPLFLRNGRYRIVQLILNVAVVGLWGGTFLSYSMMVSSLTNGIATMVAVPAVLMLLMALVYPMLGKPDYYCTWICPYGSLQELAGKIVKKKIRLSAMTVKVLNRFRQVLWFVLMWFLWTGLWFEWMGYEPFTAFFIKDASWVVISIAATFVVISLFISRPYCRFVCPTGSLFKFSEGRI